MQWVGNDENILYAPGSGQPRNEPSRTLGAAPLLLKQYVLIRHTGILQDLRDCDRLARQVRTHTTTWDDDPYNSFRVQPCREECANP